MEINALQNQIKTKVKAKEDAKDIIAERKEKAQREPELKKKAEELKTLLDRELNKIANTVDPTVPISNNEDDNEIVSTWGVCRAGGEGLLYHHDLLHRIDGYEPEKGVQVAGHRAYFLKGMGVMLNQALINYGQSFLMKRKFTLLQPPYFMSKDCMAGVAQLEDFDEQLYKVIGEDEKYLIV